MKKLLIVCVLFTTIFSYSQEKRLALVIGNSDYEKGQLKNPVNDAKLIARTLDSLGFDVIAKYNLTSQIEIKDAIKEFGSRRENYEVGFVYYAGHGIQVNDENFMIPTKGTFNSENDVQDYGVSVKSIIRYLESKSEQVNILILDACRDNPFESTWKKTRSLKGDGLAKISPPSGTLVAYSTDTGQTAADGNNINSIYTECLAKNMLIENISIDQVFRNVRSEVLKITNGTQKPVEATQLTGQTFYLVKSNNEKKFKIAEEKIKNKEYFEALNIANEILKDEPKSVKALLLRASLYEGELNQNDKALIDYNRAIEIEPKDANIYYHRTTVYENLKEYDKALLDYNKAIEMAPDNAKYFNYRGALYAEELKQNDKALADYNKSIELDPKEIFYLVNRANLFENKLKLFDKALADYNKAIELEPMTPKYYNLRAIFYRKNTKQFELALQDYNKVIELEPKEASYYSNRAILEFFDLNYKEKAYEDYRKAIELAPEERNNYYYRIKANLFIEDYENAKKDINKTIAIDKNDPESYFDLATIYKKQKKYLQSLIQISKAIDLFSNYNYVLSDDKIIDQIGIEDLYIFRAELFKLLQDKGGECEDYNLALQSIKDNTIKKENIKLLIKENCK